MFILLTYALRRCKEMTNIKKILIKADFDVPEMYAGFKVSNIIGIDDKGEQVSLVEIIEKDTVYVSAKQILESLGMNVDKAEIEFI